jgi:hypothetical protein
MDHIQAHIFSIRHRNAILASEVCGCFYCLHIFKPQTIREWTDIDGGVGQTAFCPKCGIDAVIGSASGVSITKVFLKEMQRHWFKP